MERYRVVRDLQGGEFGMGRDYTIEQWRKQGLEWCWVDDNYGLGKTLNNLPKEEVIRFIEIIWDLEFRKVRKDKKKFDKHDLTDFEDETLYEFFNKRFGYMKDEEED